jgi:hypothetical protein
MVFKSCNFERSLVSCFKFPGGTPESTLERLRTLSRTPVSLVSMTDAKFRGRFAETSTHHTATHKKKMVHVGTVRVAEDGQGGLGKAKFEEEIDTKLAEQ